MTADAWLFIHGKTPRKGQHYGAWFWYLVGGDNNDVDARNAELPLLLYRRLMSSQSYSFTTAYSTRGDALADFRWAFEQAISNGWKP